MPFILSGNYRGPHGVPFRPGESLCSLRLGKGFSSPLSNRVLSGIGRQCEVEGLSRRVSGLTDIGASENAP